MPTTGNVTLGERYALEERVAIGGMGEVWRARDLVLDRRVAVKLLKESYAADPAFLDRFRAEAKHTAALSHPGIANVFDYGEIGATAYLVMEYVDGEPLSAVLARVGALSADRTLDVVGQAALALQAAHDLGVVHRDVKPGNLIVRPDGVVKVTDFGIARAVDAAPVTQTGLVVGTAAYLSPEQAAGRPVMPASDVYALGVVAYECLTGARPFDGDSAVAVAMAHVSKPAPALPKSVPPLVADLVTRALDKQPARRPSSAGDFGRTALALAANLRPPAAGSNDAPEPDPETGAGATADGGGIADGGGTRVLTAAVPAGAAPAGPRVVGDDERKRIRNIMIAVGLAVVVLGFVVLHSCASSAQQVTMPTVTGSAYSTAAARLHVLGLNATQREVHDAGHRAGYVLGQSIRAGTKVGSGSTVTLTVASGPRTEVVDAASYVGRPVAEVTAALRAKNLVVRTTTVTAPGTAGTVVAVTPAGSRHEGDVITLTVTAPPKPAGKHGHGDKHGKVRHG